MTPRQRIELKLSESRTAIRELLDVEEPTGDQLGKLELHTRQMQQLETQLRAAILADPETEPEEACPPEKRELAKLVNTVELENYLPELFGGRVTGAAAELRDELLGNVAAGFFPAELLLDRETRADAVTSATGIAVAQQPIYQRIFNAGAASYIGANFQSVPVGTTTWPRLTGGTTADFREDGVELDGTAATITTESVNPARLTASYTLSNQSTYQLAGLEGALRNDIRMVMSDKLDSVILNGQAAVSNVSPAVEGLLDQLADPAAATAEAKALDYLNVYSNAVDGKYAQSEMGVRLLVNPATYKHAYGLQFDTSGDLLRDRLMNERFRASANMPAVASKKAQAIRYIGGAMARGLIVATWRGLQMITDPYTLAKKGQTVITAVQYTNIVAVDLQAYAQVEFQVEA